ncbi:hypothetical protein IFM46972_08113, partial [Aspergillus udagawae]
SRRIFKDEDNYSKTVAIPGAVRKTLDDAPGGGEMVTFERPDGTFFHVVYGQREREVEAKTPPTATHDSQDPFNTPFEKPRKGQFQSNFNFVHSDILYLPQFPQMDALTFMHLDLGKEYTDFHTFFLQRASPTLMGHQYLAKRGWKSVWGVGRHILGSQIFDYLYDSSKFRIEHYADGDVVNCDNATRREPVGPLSVWGPELPRDFWG